MHELPIVMEVLEIALQYAKEEQAVKINKVSLMIGELHDLIPEWVEKFFRFASRGTIAQDASLIIKQLPAVCLCSQCKEHFVLHKQAPQPWTCPVCGDESFTILSGKEFSIEQIEIVTNLL